MSRPELKMVQFSLCTDNISKANMVDNHNLMKLPDIFILNSYHCCWCFPKKLVWFVNMMSLEERTKAELREGGQ